MWHEEVLTSQYSLRQSDIVSPFSVSLSEACDSCIGSRDVSACVSAV